MNSNTQDELLRKLLEDMRKLDTVIEETVPSEAAFMRLIAETNMRRKRRERRESLLFVVLSFMLVAACLAGLGYIPVLYVALQTLIPAGALLVAAAARIRQRREDAEH